MNLNINKLLILLPSLLLSTLASALTYNYDDLNRFTSVVYDSGTMQTYSYDSAGNILSIMAPPTVGVGYPLSVDISGSGQGVVSSNPSALGCGSSCSYAFTAGTIVSLNAAPAIGSTFSGWGGVCSGTGACQVTMSAAQNVTASFSIGTGGGVVPGAPTAIVASAGNAYATVSFTIPANDGTNPILNYTVTSSPDNIMVTGNNSPIIIAGLTNGTAYTFSVTATNSSGTGLPSLASNSVTPMFLVGLNKPYVDNTDGTVTDPSSGLTWMRCALGQTWTGSYCVGIQNAYTWDQAKALSFSYAGLSDWRLPNIRELQTIVDRDNYNPAINTLAFPNTPILNFWTGSVYALYSSDSAWSVNFVDGVASYSYRRQSLPVRLVRGGQSLALLTDTRPDTDYTNNGDGTITYKPTNLIWKQCTEGQIGPSCSGTTNTYNWDKAISLSDSFAGKSDWRLPTEDELISLVDFTKSNPAINATIFPGTPLSYYYWSSSPNNNNSDHAWNVSFGTGDASSGNRSGGYSVRLVRGGQHPFVPPDAPTGVSATAGNAQANITFTASASINGTAVTVYTVNSIPAGGFDFNAGTTALNHVVTGLTNGIAYTFFVTATNAAGTSIPSSSSNSVIPTKSNQSITLGTAPFVTMGGTELVSATANSNLTVSFTSNTPTVCSVSGNMVTGLTVGTCIIAADQAGDSSYNSATQTTQSIMVIYYADNHDGTVTDIRTGLTWMRCAIGQTWDGNTCIGTGNTYTWAEATALTSTFAGISDWRLPTIRELQTISDQSRFYPAIDTIAFPNMVNDWFRSATTSSSNPSNSWSLHFGSGSSNAFPNAWSLFVRLVHGGQAIGSLAIARPDLDYTDNGDGTVTHNPTRLIWKKCSEGQTGSICIGTTSLYTWDQATALARSFAGKDDWRIPTRDELLSLVDYTIYDSAINIKSFPNTLTNPNYWSSSICTMCANSNVWSVGMYDGNSLILFKSDKNAVRLVRGGQTFAAFFPPGSPTSVSATPGNGTAVINFIAPSVIGGSAISGYTVTSSPSGGIDNDAGTTAMTHTIIGLTNGTAYTFTVTATNSIETSIASSPSNSIIPDKSYHSITLPTIISVAPGWNLLGNGIETSILVSDIFGDPTKVISLWKWVVSGNSPGVNYPAWAFYSPLQLDGGRYYAASKGYEHMTLIQGGEGFWLNAKQATSITIPAGNPIKIHSVWNYGNGVNSCVIVGVPPEGWRLQAVGESATPKQFCDAQCYSPIISLWAWSAETSTWYFYAPSLDITNSLNSYIGSKGYLDFGSRDKLLNNGTGFWVNWPPMGLTQ